MDSAFTVFHRFIVHFHSTPMSHLQFNIEWNPMKIYTFSSFKLSIGLLNLIRIEIVLHNNKNSILAYIEHPE